MLSLFLRAKLSFELNRKTLLIRCRKIEDDESFSSSWNLSLFNAFVVVVLLLVFLSSFNVSFCRGIEMEKKTEKKQHKKTH
tara:strand:- start:1856 stop:2098 length:243 start_codon:yes stop_codon:yes gene_type:complete